VTTAFARLRTLAAADGDAPALSDGQRWWTRAELAGMAERVPPADAPAVAVTQPDAAHGLVALLAAERSGAVPVIADPAWPAACRADLLAAVGLRRRARGGEPLIAVLTSGTTGNPRTVVRTAGSWAASLRSFDAVLGVRPDDVVLAPGPLSSTLTLFACWHALATGRGLITGRWRGVSGSPAATRATIVHAVPAVIADVLEAAADGRLPRLRLAVVAGSHVPTALRDQAASAGIRLLEYYGAAELSFVATDPDGRGLRPFPGCRVEVRDAAGARLPAWTDGEIWVSSPYVALGYQSLGSRPGTGPFRRSGEWASVGDHGRLRPDGSLEVRGRGDEAVDVGGHMVPVDDVESVLRDVPGVLEVACVGEPHARLGHRLVAAVQPVPGEDPVPRLREAARQALPRAARPSRWVLLDELPRTPGGKLSRQSLREAITRDAITRTQGSSGANFTPEEP
jgi:long-chain acyl-CoA synthetase